MKCTNCGRWVGAGGSFCSHCGARITGLAARGTAPSRFAAVVAHPSYATDMAFDPGRGIGVLEIAMPIVMAIFGVGFFAVFLSNARGEMALFGLVFAAVWFGVLGFLLYRIAVIATSPLVREIAVVVGRRTHVSTHHHHERDGLHGHHHTTTTYYLLLETEDGVRDEYQTSGGQAGVLVEGDIGLAYRRASRLIDFRRFAV